MERTGSSANQVWGEPGLGRTVLGRIVLGRTGSGANRVWGEPGLGHTVPGRTGSGANRVRGEPGVGRTVLGRSGSGAKWVWGEPGLGRTGSVPSVLAWSCAQPVAFTYTQPRFDMPLYRFFAQLLVPVYSRGPLNHLQGPLDLGSLQYFD